MERKPDTDLPPSIEAGMQSNYLGSPIVVGKLVEAELVEILGWVKARAAGTMQAAQMASQARIRAKEFSAIFAGERDEYSPIVGWNTRVGGLNEQIKVDLSHYWQSQRGAHGNDPYEVLYMWLVWAVVDSLSVDDNDLSDVTMGGRVAGLIRLLTGSTARRAAE